MPVDPSEDELARHWSLPIYADGSSGPTCIVLLGCGLEPVETMVFLLSESSGKVCAELPRRECRISVWVNR